ncbi:MAG TPA: hypothetical protein VGL44_06055 [Gaiellales bacterium]
MGERPDDRSGHEPIAEEVARGAGAVLGWILALMVLVIAVVVVGFFAVPR